MEKTRIKRGVAIDLQRSIRDHQIFSMRYLENLPASAIALKTGLSEGSIFRILSTFATNNPEIAEQMKKKGRDVVPEDYKKLQQELSELRKRLAMETLRADFYEEMVAYGKEVYGIDLKKVGTK